MAFPQTAMRNSIARAVFRVAKMFPAATYIPRGGTAQTIYLLGDKDAQQILDSLGLKIAESTEVFTVPRQPFPTPTFPPANGISMNDVLVYPVGAAYNRYIMRWEDVSGSFDALYLLYTSRKQARRGGKV